MNNNITTEVSNGAGWVASHVRGMWAALRGSGLQIVELAMRHNGRQIGGRFNAANVLL